MTSVPISTLIAERDPLTPPDWNEEKERQAQEQRKQVRQRCAEEYSSSPLWQARAERDPEYWNKFSPGRIR
ncbi:MAG: hypothetical protein CME38_09355 [Haliea sp.]|nr:hypothetical protein [Haliea sp.]